MHTELLVAGLWDKMAPADRAAVLSAMVASATRVDAADSTDVDARFVAEFIAAHSDLLRHVEALLSGNELPTMRQHDTEQAYEVLHLLDELPDGWRVEAMRRAMTGMPVPQAVAWAKNAIRFLAARLGLGPDGKQVNK